MRWYGLDSSGSGWGTVDGSCEHGSEPSGSIKCWEILEWLSDCWFLKDSAPWSWLWITNVSALATICIHSKNQCKQSHPFVTITETIQLLKAATTFTNIISTTITSQINQTLLKVIYECGLLSDIVTSTHGWWPQVCSSWTNFHTQPFLFYNKTNWGLPCAA
jgi:hypothetical protein